MAKKQIATFLGPQLGLTIVGDHAFAYANASASTSSATVLDFQTPGKAYVDGRIELNPQVEYANGATGVARIRIKFNGSIVGLLITEATDFYRNSMSLVIPPLTRVTVELISGEDTAAEIITIGFTARVYNV